MAKDRARAWSATTLAERGKTCDYDYASDYDDDYYGLNATTNIHSAKTKNLGAENKKQCAYVLVFTQTQTEKKLARENILLPKRM